LEAATGEEMSLDLNLTHRFFRGRVLLTPFAKAGRTSFNIEGNQDRFFRYQLGYHLRVGASFLKKEGKEV
jgi:hypothetical protein